MQRDEQVVFGVLAAASVVFYFFIIPAQIQDPDWVTVSPRLIPQACAIGIFVLSIYKLLTSLKFARPGLTVAPRSYLVLLACVALPLAAAIAMRWVGFWIPAGVMVAACLVLTGMRQPIWVVGFSVALTGATWFLLDLAGLYIR